jgi:hypothetical protein
MPFLTISGALGDPFHAPRLSTELLLPLKQMILPNAIDFRSVLSDGDIELTLDNPSADVASEFQQVGTSGLSSMPDHCRQRAVIRYARQGTQNRAET